MHTKIEIKFSTDFNKNKESFTVVFNNQDLEEIVRQGGLHAGNKAIDTFVNRFLGQFKHEFSKFLNKPSA